MIFLRLFQHLLPRARAWRITVEKPLRRFFVGLADAPAQLRVAFDKLFNDAFPTSTTQLEAWEQQWGLPLSNLTEGQRRTRLTAAWRATGGQSPGYIQATLRAAGFNVYVHEWWEPGTNTPRDPLEYLVRGDGSAGFFAQAGEDLMFCGGSFALCGNSFAAAGYPLVNKLVESRREITSLAGEPDMLCGEAVALCANFLGSGLAPKRYIIPDDPARWCRFLYIGGVTFPQLASVPAARRDEFETLCLQICPTQLWLGMLIEYN